MKNKCSICKQNETEINCEINLTDEGLPYKHTIYVCEPCLERAKDNLIFVCINCLSTFERNKENTIIKLSKSNNPEDKEILYGLMQMRFEQVITGVSSCPKCDKTFQQSNIVGNA